MAAGAGSGACRSKGSEETDFHDEPPRNLHLKAGTPLLMRLLKKSLIRSGSTMSSLAKDIDNDELELAAGFFRSLLTGGNAG